MIEVEPIVVYYSVCNGGDGSAYPQWYLYEESVDWLQNVWEPLFDGWAEECSGYVETYVGSNIYNAAVKNEAELPELKAEAEEIIASRNGE